MGIAIEFSLVGRMSQEYFALSWALGLKKEIDELDGVQKTKTITRTRYFKDEKRFFSIK